METNYPRAKNSWQLLTRNPVTSLQSGILLTYLTVLFLSNTAIAQCPTPPGDQVTYGDGSWIGYVYSGHNPITASNAFTSTYRGYVVETSMFQRDYGYDAVYGTTVCGGHQNNFSIRYKMKKTYPAGNYTFTVGGDDGYRLSIDGGSTYLVDNWSTHTYQTTTSGSVYLDGDVYLVLEYYEVGGSSTVSYMDSSCTDHSTAPTVLSGPSSVCNGQSITLTASGGTAASGATYQWGYGTTPGYYIIAGQTGESMTVVPWGTDNIWVRRIDTGSCSNTTWGIHKSVTVIQPSGSPTLISGNSTICAGTSTTLTASGGSASAGSTFQWGTETIGQNIIAGQNSASIVVNPTSNTSYWVRRVDLSPCTYTNGITKSVTVVPIGVSGTLTTASTTICANSLPESIVLSGNTGDVEKWQSAIDENFTFGLVDIIDTSTTLTGSTIGQLTSSRFFRAVVQSGSCNFAYSAPIQITVPAIITYSDGSWSGTPDKYTAVIISESVSLDSTLDVCSCQITGNTTVTIPAGVTLKVEKNLTVDPSANIIIENNGSLVQVDDSGQNIGNITMKRNTTLMGQFDYTYWSTPVQDWQLNQLSPASTLFYAFNPIINNWSWQAPGTIMTPGQGYIVRAPTAWSLTNASMGIFEGVFTGVPNTGVISVSIKKGWEAYNLIGNPYPSAIDIDLFLTDPQNAGVVNGTIYLWTHSTALSSSTPGNDTFNYTANDYAKYNLTGGVKTASAALTGTAVPNGKIASGQGFFIEANSALAPGNYTATFNNSMRIINENGQFFRTSEQSLVNPNLEKDRLWLNISNNTGGYNEMLLGYVEGATDAIDAMYDGKTFAAGNVVGIYSIVGDNNLSIQGKATPFQTADVIPIGYSTTIAGMLTVGLENFEGVFDGQELFLHDIQNDIIHDLKDDPYYFFSETGTFNNRFELRFNNSTLGITDTPIQKTAIIGIGKQIVIQSEETITSVKVYDFTGRLLFSKADINTSNFNSPDITMAGQIVIVELTLDSGKIINQKVALN